MKAEELRIGNWVELDGNPSQVQFVDPNEIRNSGDRLKPIVLSPEILEKAGFEKEEEHNKKVYSYGEYWIEIAQWNPIKVSVWKYGAMNYPCFLTQVSFLHQLQNLYFALTGEELKINNL